MVRTGPFRRGVHVCLSRETKRGFSSYFPGYIIGSGWMTDHDYVTMTLFSRSQMGGGGWGHNIYEGCPSK